jgi:RNA polymerase sigma-70 factor (ECF subfamily)
VPLPAPGRPPDTLPDFDDFYTRHYRPIVGLAFALTGSASSAEDLAQEAFATAFRRWEEISRFDDPATWVRRVVSNQCVSWFRRRLVEARALARLRGQRAWTAELAPGDERIWQAVRALPRRQAQVVALYYVADRSLDDVAAVLGCSVETVRTLCAGPGRRWPPCRP